MIGFPRRACEDSPVWWPRSHHGGRWPHRDRSWFCLKANSIAREPGVGPPHTSDALSVRGGGGLSFRKVPGSPPGAFARGVELPVAFLTRCGPGHSGRFQTLLLLGARRAHGQGGRLLRPAPPQHPQAVPPRGSLRPRRPRPRQNPRLQRQGTEASVPALSRSHGCRPLTAESAEPPHPSEGPGSRGKWEKRFSGVAGEGPSSGRLRLCSAVSGAGPGLSCGLGSLVCTCTRRHAPRHAPLRLHTPVHQHRHAPQ